MQLYLMLEVLLVAPILPLHPILLMLLILLIHRHIVLLMMSLLQEERRTVALRREVESALTVVQQYIPSEAAMAEAARAGVEGAVPPSEALLAAQEKLMRIIGAVLQVGVRRVVL